MAERDVEVVNGQPQTQRAATSRPLKDTILPKVAAFHSRWDFILRRCEGSRVLHLGCVGATSGSTSIKVKAMQDGHALHARLRKVASHVTGLDYDSAAVEALREAGYREIVYGDAENLDVVELHAPFDVILCGDLIEHLSCPGRMLDQLKRVMSKTTELLITTPNAFGLLAFLRHAANRYREGDDHVASFSIFTLRNLLTRHGYVISEAYTCYDRPPTEMLERLTYRVGSWLFNLGPKWGGTILIVARTRASEGVAAFRPQS